MLNFKKLTATSGGTKIVVVNLDNVCISNAARTTPPCISWRLTSMGNWPASVFESHPIGSLVSLFGTSHDVQLPHVQINRTPAQGYNFALPQSAEHTKQNRN